MTSFTARFFSRQGKSWNHSTDTSADSDALRARSRCSVRSSAMRTSAPALALVAALLASLLTSPAAVWAEDTQSDPIALAAATPSVSVTPEQELLGRMEAMDSVRIVMHALPPADRLADQLSSLLAALGATQVEQRVVDEVPSSNQVRFYHAADRAAGQVVGDALALIFDDVAVRDFGDYQPVPSEGLIEVWLR